MQVASLDDENQRLKLKHKEDLKDRELTSIREIQRLKESHSTAEQSLKDQITQLESMRTSLERVRRVHLSRSSLIVIGNGIGHQRSENHSVDTEIEFRRNHPAREASHEKRRRQEAA